MKSNLALLFSLLLLGCAQPQTRTDPEGLRLWGPEHFLDGYPARGRGDTIHVVVEIPAGTNDKWEVDKSDGSLAWEIKNGKPRVVQYLPYPANYGMVPRTLLPKELGGDGDPLDVLLLGPATDRGALVEARLVGVLRLLDGGEQDDKLIAISVDAPLGQVATMAALEAEYAGIITILETWMSNYKGPGELRSLGFGEVDEARKILDAAAAAYEQARR